MDTFLIKLDGKEVARISGDDLELGKRAVSATELLDDPKCVKKIMDGQTVFVLMASSRTTVTVERVR